MVQRAWFGLGKAEATMAPEAEATMVEMIGRSQAAVMVLRFVSGFIMIVNGTKNVTIMAITASIHQSVQARTTAEYPHEGTQANMIMLMIVAKPTGKVPRNSDCTGCRIIVDQVSG